jgi:hypothetical protein
MPRGLLRAAVCVIVLSTACSLTLGGTISAYTGSVATASNTFTAAADFTAPVTAAAAVGRSSAYETGFIKDGATYYVYAKVSDSGNPSSGIASVAANVSSITSGSTAVALTAGSVQVTLHNGGSLSDFVAVYTAVASPVELPLG